MPWPNGPQSLRVGNRQHPPSRFSGCPLGAALPPGPTEDPGGVPAAAPDGSEVPRRCSPDPLPAPAPRVVPRECGLRRAVWSPGQGRAGQAPHTQAGYGRPRQDPQVRKRSRSQRGEHVGADGPDGCLRELGSPGEPPAVPARPTPRPRPRPPGQSSFGRRPAMRWMFGSV